MQTIGNYKIDIYSDTSFKQGSMDNLHSYDFEYFEESEFIFSTMFGIKVYQNDQLLKSAIIGSIGGGTGVHKNSTLVEDTKVLICCSDSIFCLSIPDLKLLWQTHADQATCFGIYNHCDGYIVHGELQISRLDKDGKILWQQFGSDIFTTIDGKDNFELIENFITVTDWQNRVYKFGYNGEDLTDS